MNNKGEALSTQVPEKKLILDLFSRVERNDTFLFSSRIIRFHPPSRSFHTVPYTIFTLFYRYYPRIGETEKRFSRFSPRRLLSNASLTHQQWTLNSDSPMFDEEMTRMRDKLASLVFKAALTVSKLPLPGRV